MRLRAMSSNVVVCSVSGQLGGSAIRDWLKSVSNKFRGSAVSHFQSEIIRGMPIWLDRRVSLVTTVVHSRRRISPCNGVRLGKWLGSR